MNTEINISWHLECIIRKTLQDSSQFQCSSENIMDMKKSIQHATIIRKKNFQQRKIYITTTSHADLKAIEFYNKKHM